jgi:hypothetical protein
MIDANLNRIRHTRNISMSGEDVILDANNIGGCGGKNVESHFSCSQCGRNVTCGKF